MAAKKTPLERIFEILGGPSGVSRALAESDVKITPWACNKWLRAGRLPRTDYTRETNYAELLERAARRAGLAAHELERVSAERLLDNR
jgi:hypothetical protein